jgi:hypothetical protein
MKQLTFPVFIFSSCKKIMQTSFLLLVLSIFIISCKKSHFHENTFSATVNGTEFMAKTIEVLISGTSVPGAKAVNIYATNTNGSLVFLTIYTYNGTKTTFKFDDIIDGTSGFYCLEGCGNWYAVTSGISSGELKINSFKKTTDEDERKGEVVTGTFHFETDDTGGKFTFTNGKFSLLVPGY